MQPHWQRCLELAEDSETSSSDLRGRCIAVLPRQHWSPRRDSNPYFANFKSAASADWTTWGGSIGGIRTHNMKGLSFPRLPVAPRWILKKSGLENVRPLVGADGNAPSPRASKARALLLCEAPLKLNHRTEPLPSSIRLKV